MSDWLEERERIAAHAEDVQAQCHDSVERVQGDDGDDDTIVARDGDTVAAILLLDEENVDAMAEAESEGTLAQWLREELAEDAERDEDELVADEDDELEAAADAWLGDDGEIEAEPDPAATAAAADDDDDFDLDDWDDPEADALIDELPG